MIEALKKAMESLFNFISLVAQFTSQQASAALWCIALKNLKHKMWSSCRTFQKGFERSSRSLLTEWSGRARLQQYFRLICVNFKIQTIFYPGTSFWWLSCKPWTAQAKSLQSFSREVYAKTRRRKHWRHSSMDLCWPHQKQISELTDVDLQLSEWQQSLARRPPRCKPTWCCQKAWRAFQKMWKVGLVG